MSMRNRTLVLWITLIVGVSLFLALAMGSASSFAAPSALPIRPTPASYTPTPTPTPLALPRHTLESMGSYIALHVTPAATNMWSVVEWQDERGDWHVVVGWQGTLEVDGTKIWWLPGTLFGAGPFRWQLYAQKGGERLATSDVFYLPHAQNMTTHVWIDLE